MIGNTGATVRFFGERRGGNAAPSAVYERVLVFISYLRPTAALHIPQTSNAERRHDR
jgi:hypothetical protein